MRHHQTLAVRLDEVLRLHSELVMRERLTVRRARTPARGDSGGDEVHRNETNGAGRELEAETPVGATVVLDYNRAYNPTCAFSAYSLCPLSPRQNRLPLRVPASEKRPQSQ
ncbi:MULTISPECIES: DUF1684 domain-containing protein [Myxococcus]|uniref:DUF1684 domain-containing protein n=1 Tax=Myxococcus TaxID=32 RepID=UPI0003189C02|nr:MULTISPECIES: DUF1684 domain-containing protein [Myxococcus]NOJ53642.1 DUF1684 domain-containing protein [Myxococcus xanthus]QPM77739.1 DUF1684 domain-containing protein [Myxococcus xanthus]QVW66807.1 DUF1684 domain-containing protein [Myxococcus xanthus DZ2]QZZ52914.1 hypothetical protein MyxoNM_27245 [Myxococcus xanthus]UEO07065.1 DUF1684 domain-containing protein [Myxococcus xanthus DZ2]